MAEPIARGIPTDFSPCFEILRFSRFSRDGVVQALRVQVVGTGRCVQVLTLTRDCCVTLWGAHPLCA